jgi:hypothetical protein
MPNVKELITVLENLNPEDVVMINDIDYGYIPMSNITITEGKIILDGER